MPVYLNLKGHGQSHQWQNRDGCCFQSQKSMHTFSRPITPKHCNLKHALSDQITVSGNCNLHFVVVFSSSNQCNSCLLSAVTQELLFTPVWPRGSVHCAFRVSFLFPPLSLGHSRGCVIPGAGMHFPAGALEEPNRPWLSLRPRGLHSAPAPASCRGTGTAGPLCSHRMRWEENRRHRENQGWRSTARGRAWSRRTAATWRCNP